MDKYTHFVFLTEHYPVLMLNTVPNRDACVFLKNSLCTIHDAKPRACRHYPFGTGPNDDLTDFEYLLVSQATHHFTGETQTVKQWFDRCFPAVEREILMSDYKLTQRISHLLCNIPAKNKDQAMTALVLYKYVYFRMDQDFHSQFIQNGKYLIRDLKKLAEGD